MKRTRTPCSARSGSSRSIVSAKISISASTSSSERDQFSVENANTTRSWMPRSIAASTMRRTVRAPARWPAAVGSRRRFAQRPLPSRMIATDCATSGRSSRSGGRSAGERADAGEELHHGGFHQTSMISASLRFSSSSIRATCSSVSFWTRASAARSSSSPTLAVLDELLEVLDRVAAHVAHGDPALLGHLLHELDELLAALLGQLRDRQADQLAVVRRRQAEIGLLDRLLDLLDRRSGRTAGSSACAARAS